jgi:hypothetical protein
MTSARCRRFPTAPRARVALFTHSTGSLLLSRSLSDWIRADNALRHFFCRRVPHLAGSNIQTFRVTQIWPAPSFRFCEDSEPSRDTPAHRDNLRTFKAMTTSATMPLMGQAALRLIPQSAQLDVGLIAPSIVCSFSPTASYPACPDLGFRLGVSNAIRSCLSHGQPQFLRLRLSVLFRARRCGHVCRAASWTSCTREVRPSLV